jgi:hypothetical protein
MLRRIQEFFEMGITGCYRIKVKRAATKIQALKRQDTEKGECVI